MTKKTNIFFIVLSVVLFSACGTTSKKNVFEQEAKAEMQKKMENLAKFPSSVKIENLETAYLDDSICILNYIFTAENAMGIRGSKKYEFVYHIDRDGELKAHYTNLEEDKSILQVAKESYRNLVGTNKVNDNVDKDLVMDVKKGVLTLEITCRELLNGYYVVGKEQEDEKLGIEDW